MSPVVPRRLCRLLAPAPCGTQLRSKVPEAVGDPGCGRGPGPRTEPGLVRARTPQQSATGPSGCDRMRALELGGGLLPPKPDGLARTRTPAAGSQVPYRVQKMLLGGVRGRKMYEIATS